MINEKDLISIFALFQIFLSSLYDVKSWTVQILVQEMSSPVCKPGSLFFSIFVLVFWWCGIVVTWKIKVFPYFVESGPTKICYLKYFIKFSIPSRLLPLPDDAEGHQDVWMALLIVWFCKILKHKVSTPC